MAVAYRGGAAQNEADPVNSLTITIPAGVQTDDVLYVSVTAGPSSISSVAVVDDDSGGNPWTLFATITDIVSRVYYKLATSATASKTITVSSSGGGTRISAILDAYSGADTSSPHDAVVGEANASSDESSTGFTPSVANCFIHCSIFSVDNDSAIASVSCTDPGALTSRQFADTTSGIDCSVGSFSALQSGGPSATGTVSYSLTPDATSRTALWAVKPFVAGSGHPTAKRFGGVKFAAGRGGGVW
jgi:hypothetical protein